MNKITTILILAIYLHIASCCHEAEYQPSTCMLEKIETFKSDAAAKAVYSYVLDNEVYFWFNTDATFYDGAEYIYGNDCNQACYFCGECSPPECTQDFPYDKSKWEIVWKP
jgi:hypothetical protein